MRFPESLSKKVLSRRQANAYRTLRLRSDGIDFYSNDYISISQILSSSQSSHSYAGATGARLISGNYPGHMQLEKRLSGIFRAESCLLFNSGYDANLGVLSSIPGRKDLILYDELVHASMIDGMRLSYAQAYKFSHNCLHSLESLLSRFSSQYENIFILIESVYSMDGDIAPIAEINSLCATYKNVYFIIDEAHALGVCGYRGLGFTYDPIVSEYCVARIYTFGKGLGVYGACVFGSKDLISYLINFARSFIYTTALPVAAVDAVNKALDLLAMDDLRQKLAHNISLYRALVYEYNLENTLSLNSTAIQTMRVGSNERVEQVERLCERNKFLVKAVKSPTVPKGAERLRICVHAHNTEDQLNRLLYVLSSSQVSVP